MLLKFIKKYRRKKVDQDFDKIYSEVEEIAKSEHNYEGDIKIISDNKWVKFYTII